MNNTELEALIEQGEARRYKDGSVRWTSENQRGKTPGTYLMRPPQAYPLMTKATAKEMRQRRHILAQERAEDALIRAASEFTGQDYRSLGPALGVYLEKLAKMFLQDDKLGAWKELIKIADLLANKSDLEGISVRDSQVIIVMKDNYTPDEAREMVQMSPEYAQQLLDHADWRDADDIYDVVMEELEENEVS